MYGGVGLFVAHHTQGIDLDWAWLADLVDVTDAALFNTRHHRSLVRVMVGK
jgi:hypothetical protein